jgi:hypothetical protein
MGTRKSNRKSKKSNKRFRKTRSKNGGRDSGRDVNRLSKEWIEHILHFYYDQEDISDKISRRELKKILKKLKYDEDYISPITGEKFPMERFGDQAMAKVDAFNKYGDHIGGGKRKTHSKRQRGAAGPTPDAGPTPAVLAARAAALEPLMNSVDAIIAALRIQMEIFERQQEESNRPSSPTGVADFPENNNHYPPPPPRGGKRKTKRKSKKSNRKTRRK